MLTEDFLDGMRNQTAVYWAAGVLDGAGNVSWAAGVEIQVRWENKNELFMTTTGQEKTSQAVVYIDGAQAINVDDRLFLGALTDLDSNQLADPDDVENTFRVQQINVTQTLDNETTLKKAML